jgi:hypothetical protein
METIDGPGHKPLPKWFLPAAGGVILIGLYYAYKSSQASAAAGTGAAPVTATPSGTVEMAAASQSTGADQQALIDQLNSALSSLFGPTGTVTAQNAALSTQVGSGITALGANDTSNAQQLLQAQTALAQQIQAAQQAGDAATVAALQQQQTAITAQLQAQTTATGGALSQLWQSIQAAFGGVGTSLTAGQAASATQNQALVNQLQQEQTAFQALFGTVQTQQFWQAGRLSGASCLAPDGNISLNCAQTVGEPDFGHGDTNTTTIKAAITKKYGSCITNNIVDYACAGRIASGASGLPGH